MVTFDIPDPVPMELMALVPDQQEAVNKLFTEGKLAFYSLSMDRQRLWTVVNASTEEEAMDVIATFPVIRFLTPELTELMFSHVPHLMASVSMN